jgi:hypothetical protein
VFSCSTGSFCSWCRVYGINWFLWEGRGAIIGWTLGSTLCNIRLGATPLPLFTMTLMSLWIWRLKKNPITLSKRPWKGMIKSDSLQLSSPYGWSNWLVTRIWFCVLWRHFLHVFSWKREVVITCLWVVCRLVEGKSIWANHHG